MVFELKRGISDTKLKETLDVEKIRNDFPILKIKMNGKPLAYLDSAATSQKPIQVIDTISEFYKTYNANIHRGIYQIAERATEVYIDSKKRLAGFINAGSYQEIVYVRNTTEAINLVAYSWGGANIKKGDHILISDMEHHSNIVPWQLLAKKKGAALDYVKLDSSKTRLDMQSFKENIEKRPVLFAITHVSNVLGTINDVEELTKQAHAKGTTVLVDGAQSVPHMEVDVKEIDCDFFAFSAHKMLGPTGIGALYAKSEILERMEPFISGGDMIKTVEHQSATWNDLPWRFEAGTSNIADGIGWGAAVDYLAGLGMKNVREHEKEITKYALEKLAETKGVRIFGLGAKDVEHRGGVIAFSINGIHPHDVAQIFDSEGIAIRAGHHCAMPLVRETLGENALSRMSFYVYNNTEEVDRALEAIEKAKKLFNRV